VLTFEGGENLRYDAHSIDVGISGIKRLLFDQKMLAEKPVANHKTPTFVNHSTWIRAGMAGLFQWTKKSGYPVRKGEPIGFITDPQAGKANKRLLSPRDGFIIGHANAAVISQGDALFHIGWKG
jgi:predicted deacylase